MTEKTALAEMIEQSKTSKVEYCKFEKSDFREDASELIRILQEAKKEETLCQKDT